MARKCSSSGCGFLLPDQYPLDKCPWHMAPGSGPVKIAAALTIAAAGFGGGFAYKKFRAYLRNKNKRRDTRRTKEASKAKQQTASAAHKTAGAKSKKRTGTRKRSASKSKQKTAESAAS